jgi:hypothetical protein
MLRVLGRESEGSHDHCLACEVEEGVMDGVDDAWRGERADMSRTEIDV